MSARVTLEAAVKAPVKPGLLAAKDERSAVGGRPGRLGDDPGGAV